MIFMFCFIDCSVAQEVKRFTGNLKDWLRAALKDIPQCLSAVKFKGTMICSSSCNTTKA